MPEISREPRHETGLFGRIDHGATIKSPDTHGHAQADLVIGPKLRPHFGFVIARTIAVIGMDCRCDALAEHARCGQPRDRIGIENAMAAPARNPGLEEIIVIAELNLAQPSAMLVRVDEPRHDDAPGQRNEFRARPAFAQDVRLIDLRDAPLHNRQSQPRGEGSRLRPRQQVVRCDNCVLHGMGLRSNLMPYQYCRNRPPTHISGKPGHRARGFPMSRAVVYAVALLACVPLGIAAAQARDYKAGSLDIIDPWSRATPKGASVAAGYMKITNTGTSPDRLVSGTFDAASTFEVHEMT